MKIKHESLANGLEVLLVNDPSCPSVTVMVSVKAGSRNEDPAQAGIAHLIEHNLFKGTHKRPTSKDISFEVENLGAYQNAYTDKEGTCYFIKGPYDKVLTMIDILADMIVDPLFPETEFEKEKKVICEEIKMYEDIPQEKIYDKFLEALYPTNQLGKNIAGSISSLKTITTSDCREFMKKFYTINNMVLIVSGKFNEKEIIARLNDTFTQLSHHKINAPEKFAGLKLNGKILNYKKKIEQTHIMIGGYAPDYNVPQRARLPFFLGRTIMAGGMGAKLHLKIREELGLAYYISMGGQSFKETGYYCVGLGVDHARIDEAIEAVLKELNNFKMGQVTDKEFERAKNLLVGSMITSFETSDEIASWYGRQVLQGQELVSWEETVKMLKEIDLKEVIEFWGNWLSNENLQIVTLGNLMKNKTIVKL